MPGFNGTANEVSPGSCRPDDNMVFNSLFLPVQVAVEQAIVAARANASVPTPVWGQVWVQRFPGGGCHVDNKMLNVGLAAPSTLFALMLSVTAVAWWILELQWRTRVSVQAKSLEPGALWCMLSSLFGAYCVLAAAGAATMMKLGVFPHSNWALQFLLCLCAWLSAVLSSALLTQARGLGEGTLVLVGLWRVLLPLVGLFLAFPTVPEGLQLVACMFGPTALYFGTVVLNNAEGVGGGILWASALTPVPGAGVKAPLGAILVMQVIGLVLSVVALRVLRVSSERWREAMLGGAVPHFRREEDTLSDLPPMHPRARAAPSEAIPESVWRHRSLEVVDVCKAFRHSINKWTVVLRRISLDLFDNQIVVLMGPNGSGKSTLLSMLAGESPLDCGGTIQLHGPGKDLQPRTPPRSGTSLGTARRRGASMRSTRWRCTCKPRCYGPGWVRGSWMRRRQSCWPPWGCRASRVSCAPR